MRTKGKFIAFMEERVLPVAGAIASQRHLKAMRDGLMYTIPLTILGGLTLIVANPPVDSSVPASNFLLQLLVAWRDWAKANGEILLLPYKMTMGLMGLFAAINIAFNLAREYKMDTLSASMISGIVFLVVAAPIDGKGMIPGAYLDAKGIFTAILIGLVTVEITRFLKRQNITIKMPDGVPPAVSSSFDALIPIVFNMMLFYGLSLIIQRVSGMIVPQAIMMALAPAIKGVDTPVAIALFGILAQLFWFTGLHGATIVKTGVLEPFLQQNLLVNSQALIQGQGLPHVFTEPFWAYFVVLGGSGATLGLSLMILRSRSQQLRALGKVALLPGLFNINEPVIFGTPMVLNPLMLIPFVLVGPINGIIAFYATLWGVVKPTVINVPWTTPAPLGAFLATMDWRAILLVVLLIVVDVLLYYPFYKIYEKQLIRNEQDH